MFRDTANPVRDTASGSSDPNGTLFLAQKLDYITNKLTSVMSKLDSIDESLNKWDTWFENNDNRRTEKKDEVKSEVDYGAD